MNLSIPKKQYNPEEKRIEKEADINKCARLVIANRFCSEECMDDIARIIEETLGAENFSVKDEISENISRECCHNDTIKTILTSVFSSEIPKYDLEEAIYDYEGAHAQTVTAKVEGTEYSFWEENKAGSPRMMVAMNSGDGNIDFSTVAIAIESAIPKDELIKIGISLESQHAN